MLLLLGVLVPVHRLPLLMKFGSPPYPALASDFAWVLHGGKASRFVHGQRHGVRTLSRSRLRFSCACPSGGESFS